MLCKRTIEKEIKELKKLNEKIYKLDIGFHSFTKDSINTLMWVLKCKHCCSQSNFLKHMFKIHKID